MENESKMEQLKSCCKNPKNILIFVGMLLLTIIVVVSIVRDRLVDRSMNQVTINGEGRIAYRPDTATITLGFQVDKAKTAEEATQLLSEKMNNIISAAKSLGIPDEDIKTKNYTLFPQYDYKDGVSAVAGYNANQQVEIKAKGIDQNREIVSQIISATSRAGSNQVLSVTFDVSNLNDLKQQARIKAIQDARSKAGDLAKAAGVKKLKKVVGWYENVIQSPDMPNNYGFGGMGAGGEASLLSSKQMVSPDVPSGNQEIIIGVGVNYEIK